MPTLRTHMIDASNTKAFPATRYHLQQHNSLQQTNKKRLSIQPVRYVSVIKNILIKAEKTKILTSQKKGKETKKLIQVAQNIWKKGHGTIERVDKKTGDIFHLAHKKAIYEQVLQKGKIDLNSTDTSNEHNIYQSHLIRVKTPLKINQQKPSEVLPQKVIMATPIQVNKGNSILAEEEIIISKTLQQNLKNITAVGHSLGEAIKKQVKKTLTTFQTTPKQAGHNKKLSVLRGYIS